MLLPELFRPTRIVIGFNSMKVESDIDRRLIDRMAVSESNYVAPKCVMHVNCEDLLYLRLSHTFNSNMLIGTLIYSECN